MISMLFCFKKKLLGYNSPDPFGCQLAIKTLNSFIRGLTNVGLKIILIDQMLKRREWPKVIFKDFHYYKPQLDGHRS